MFDAYFPDHIAAGLMARRDEALELRVAENLSHDNPPWYPDAQRALDEQERAVIALALRSVLAEMPLADHNRPAVERLLARFTS